jgi:hypothetical protein
MKAVLTPAAVAAAVAVLTSYHPTVRPYRFIGQMNRLPLTGRIAHTAPPNSNVVPPILGIFEQCS